MSEEGSRKVTETALWDSDAWRAAGKWASRTVGRFKTKHKIFVVVAATVFVALCVETTITRIEVGNLNSTVSYLESEIDDLNSNVRNLEWALDDLESRMDDVCDVLSEYTTSC